MFSGKAGSILFHTAGPLYAKLRCPVEIWTRGSKMQRVDAHRSRRRPRTSSIRTQSSHKYVGAITADLTRRPASTERTERGQFQATGQSVSRTQASDAMTSRLPRYEAKCVQRRCFQSGRSLCVQISRERSYLLPIYWYHSKSNWLRYNLPLIVFINETLQQTSRPLLCCPKDDKFRHLIPILRKLGVA